MNLHFCRKALTNKVRAFFIFSFLLFIGCQSSQVGSQFMAVPEVHHPIEPVRKLQSDASGNEFIISFLGDVIIHERLRLREELTHEGYPIIWSGIQKYIEAADIRYANLEGPVAPEIGGVSGFPLFNYPEAILPALKSSGIDVVSTANNHALDRHASGIKKTIEHLKDYQLSFTGTITSPDHVLQKKETWWALSDLKGAGLKNTNLKLAWLACTEMTNGNHDTENQVLYCYKDKEKIKNLIDELRHNPDVAGIILTPHWGEEEKFEIQLGRRLWAQTMINSGALAIVGSHPHVVQKLEEYITATGRRSFIAYSLGNFVSNQPWIPNKASMQLLAKMKINEQEKIELVDLKYIALWMNRTIEKEGSAKFRLSPVWQMTKMPKEAIAIWNEQLGEERRLKDPAAAENFFKK